MIFYHHVLLLTVLTTKCLDLHCTDDEECLDPHPNGDDSLDLRHTDDECLELHYTEDDEYLNFHRTYDEG